MSRFAMILMMAGGILLFSGPGARADVLGVILTEDIAYYGAVHAVMLKAIEEFSRQQRMEVIVQKPTPELMPMVNAARKLSTLGARVIVTYGTTATLVAMKEITNIPIIFAGVHEPDLMKISGKNATGISGTVPMREVLTRLREVKNFSRLGILFSKSEKGSILQAREAKDTEKSLGFESQLIDVLGPDHEAEIAKFDALLFTVSDSSQAHMTMCLREAYQRKVPSAAIFGSGNPEQEATVVLAPNVQEQGTQLTAMVKQVLNGSAPSAIPIQDPRQFDLIINQRGARTIGLDLPAALLEKATQVLR